MQLFPPIGLDQSILTAVLLGLLLLLMFTELFGWVFVGLVVPGYLASIFVVQPAAGITVVVESMVTYAVVRVLSDWLARSDAWSPFFGRERFFLIVLVSVLVRQASQLWLLPTTLGWIDDVFQTDIYSQQNFFSVGLVLVPLTANMFWKLGLRRGWLQVAVPVAITYLLLQLILLPLTNLSFSMLELTYENVALDFLGSAKAYMILLSAAFIAARFNLAYGWDYNGILVPSLLALTWFWPTTALVTIFEALLLYLLTRAVLAIPLLKTINLEGPRKVALIFVIGYLLKFSLGWGVSYAAPTFDLVSMFGFGYVLTSLLAVKMINKRVVGRIIFPTLVVSLLGFVVGSAVGFGLEQIAPGKLSPQAPSGESVRTTALLQSSTGVATLARARARTVPQSGWRHARTARQLAEYSRLWRDIDRWLKAGSPAIPETVRERAVALGLSLEPVGDLSGEHPVFALVEREERLRFQTGWDTALLVPGATGPILEVPRPRREAPAAEVADLLCRRLQCRGVLFAGVDTDSTRGGDPLRDKRSTFQVAHRWLRGTAVVQIRATRTGVPGKPTLYLRHLLPEHVNLRSLWPEQLSLSWDRPPGPNQQWDVRASFAVLELHVEDAWRLLSESAEPPARVEAVSLGQRLQTLIPKGGVTPPSGLPLTPASETELRVLDEQLVGVLIDPNSTPAQRRWVARIAALIDYHLVELPQCAGAASPCMLLEEVQTPPRRRWGSLAVRVGPRRLVAIEIPRPHREGGTLAIGIELWTQLNAAVLLAAAGEPDVAPERTRNPAALGRVATPFHAMHQSLLFALGESRKRPTVLQIRGFSSDRAIDADIVIGLGAPALERRQVPKLVEQLIRADGILPALGGDESGATVRLADGAPELVALAGQGTPQLAFAQRSGEADMVLLWFSRVLRSRYRASPRVSEAKLLTDAGLAPTDAPVVDSLIEPRLNSPLVPPLRALATLLPLVGLAERYADQSNVHTLELLVSQSRARGVALRALWDATSQRHYFLLELSLERRDEDKQIARAAVPLSESNNRACTPRLATARAAGPGLDRQRRDLAWDRARRCGTLFYLGIGEARR